MFALMAAPALVTPLGSAMGGGETSTGRVVICNGWILVEEDLA
jgi:hypothetical protein